MSEDTLSPSHGGSFNIYGLIHRVLKSWPYLIAFCILGFLGALLYLKYAKEEYNSNGTMLIKSRFMLASSTDRVEALMNQKAKYADLLTEMAFFESPPVMQRVVQKLGLDYSYTEKGVFKDIDAYKMVPFQIESLSGIDSLASFTFLAQFKNSNQFTINNDNTIYSFGEPFKLQHGTFRFVKLNNAKPGTVYEISRQPYEEATYKMLEGVSILPKVENTGILSVHGNFANPYLAADVVNNLMTSYSTISSEQANNNLEQLIFFVNGRLGLLEKNIDSLKRILLEYQKANGIANASSQLSDKLSMAQQQEGVILANNFNLSNLQEIESYLIANANKNNNVVAPSNLGIEDGTLNQNIQKYNEAVAQRRLMLESNITVDNPQITQIDNEIEAVRKTALESIRVLKKGYSKNLSNAASLKSANKSEALNMPQKISEQIDLENQLSLKQGLFKMLSEKKEEAAISRASYVSTSVILEKARPVLTATRPNPLSIKLTGVFMGLLLPVLFILFKHLTDNRINSREDIESETKAPILGEIPHSNSKGALVVKNNNRTHIAEQFRMIRTNLDYITTNGGEKLSILVTSSFGSEGKSFVTTNLGAAVALTGKKTVLLEFDLRKPNIINGLGLQGSKFKGISNFIVSNNNIDELLVPVEGNEHLFVLPCGPIPPNPSELLLRDKMNDLFTELKKRFDCIIIDSAPVGILSDAIILSKYADCTIFITRQGHTLKKQLKNINEMYEEKRLPNMGIVLNDIRASSVYYSKYGYGSYGYYSYKEGKGYFEDVDKKPKSWVQKIKSRKKS